MVAIQFSRRPFWFCAQSAGFPADAVDQCLRCLTENDEPPNKCLQYADPIEAEMHVKIDNSKGPWHRLTIDGARTPGSVLEPHQGPQTACGQRVIGYYGTRNETYDGDLCRGGCFTPFELTLARLRREEREEQQASESDARTLSDDLAANRIKDQRALEDFHAIQRAKSPDEV